MNAETDESVATSPGSDPATEGPGGRPDEPTPSGPDKPTPRGPDPHKPQTSGLKPQYETRNEDPSE